MGAQKTFKKPVVSAIAITAASALLVSAVALAARVAGQPSDNPWDYTMYAFRERNAYRSTAEQLTVVGDIRSGGSAVFSGDSAEVSGNVVAGGNVEKNVISFHAGHEITNAAPLTINSVFSDVYRIATDHAELSYEESIVSNSLTINNPIVGNSDLSIDISKDNAVGDTEEEADYKYGAFGAEFLTTVYENPEEWSKVLPFLFTDSALSDNDLLKLGEQSAFIPVGEQEASDNWSNYDKLPGAVFQDHLSVADVPTYIAKRKQDNAVFQVCNSETNPVTIQCAYDNSTINPAEADAAAHIVVTGGNFTLDGDYENLVEIRFDNWGGAQLLGSYPNLKYIYMTTWSNINLAGEFPSLECVYLTGGQMLLGSGDLGFSASNADILNDNGTTIIYTAKDVSLSNCRIAAAGTLVIRGHGKTADPSIFLADNTLFAASGAITFEDMNDQSDVRTANISVFYSGAPMSFVKCRFDLLQGCFISQNGAMVLTETDIRTLRGYVFSPLGINKYAPNSTTNIYINTYSYNIFPNIHNLNEQQDGIWNKGTIETIETLEAVRFPLKLAGSITDIEGFISDVTKTKNDDGEYVEKYSIKGVVSDTGTLTLNSSLFADGNITITTGYLKGEDQAKSIIASRAGDIIITVDSGIEWNGIIFAPNGKVTLYGSGQINGRIFAQEIEIFSDTLSIIGGDEDISELGFTAPPKEETTTTSAESSDAEDKTTTSVTTTTMLESETTSSSSINTTTDSETDTTATTTVTITGVDSEYTQAQYEYDKLGRLIKVIYDEENYIEYVYDANGNIIEVKKTIDGIAEE